MMMDEGRLSDHQQSHHDTLARAHMINGVTLESLNKRLSYLHETLHMPGHLLALDCLQLSPSCDQASITYQQYHDDILKFMKSCLLKVADHQSICQVLRVVDPFLSDILPLMVHVEHPPSLATLDVIGVIMQYTDKFNYTLLEYLTQANGESLSLMVKGKRWETLFRMVEAQPYLVKMWNVIGAVSGADRDEIPVEQKFLIAWLRQRAIPQNQHLIEQYQSLKTIDNLEYLDTLRLDPSNEQAKQHYFRYQLFGDQLSLSLVITERPSSKMTSSVNHKGKVMTRYLQGKVEKVREEMDRKVFQHFSIRGEEGSGKMSFIELLSQDFHVKKEENQHKLIVVTLEETFDSKNLVGTYVCNESGEFVFKKGPLTVAAEEGLWLVLRHIEKAPSDLLSFLLPLVQENILQVTVNFNIIPKLGFRIFALCHQHASKTPEDIKPFMSHLATVELNKLMDFNQSTSTISREDFENEILPQIYPMTYSVPQLSSLLIDSIRNYLNPKMHQLKGQMLDFKPLSVRQIFKAFSRVENYLSKHYRQDDLRTENFYLSTNARMNIVEDIIDIYLGYLYDKDLKIKLIIELIQTVWNSGSDQQASLDPISVAEYVTQHNRQFGINEQQCFFGRAPNMQVEKKQLGPSDCDNEIMHDEGTTHLTTSERKFVYTGTTLRLMEQIAQAINQNEATLLVGETGTGKTTSVQELANILGRKMHVFNMNQNTDSSDLLGGFKPVDIKFLLKPLYEKFLSVFKSEFKSLEKNKKFLDLTQKCYEENRVKEFLQCLNHGVTAISGKKNFIMTDDLKNLEHQIAEVQKRSSKLESGGGFIFQFIEGTLIKSIKNGEWILLDEINLASESVLNRLATIIDGDYILLNERADIIETKRHKDFRLFFCMNPPYTSAGKKQLPWSLRSKLTELYVPELDNQNDLWMIIDRNCSPSIPEQIKRRILEFYINVRDQVQKQTKRGNIGLRNLSRSLSFMKQAIQLKYPMLKALYDSLYTCFASHLDGSLQKYIQAKIIDLFEIKQMPQLAQGSEYVQSDKYTVVEQFIIPKGKHQNTNFNQRDFVITKTFKRLLKQLAGIVAVSDYAVILQGPTSAGKTSTVQYLANVTHNKVIRINNHMHTDISEYLGSYVPDKEGGGKLVFQEGVLVEAVRNGYWVILDELNLAPSEVLEALNRLLDDNRELLIVETQKVIKAHPNFRIFATQNPTEGYGGRKELSEAFKNRFILINVDDVPLDELVEILIHKCQLPKSRAEVMVKVMEALQIYRSQGSNLFSGKDSTITVRDLLKWAGRLTHQASTSTALDLAIEGFLVLGERSRNQMDKLFIKETIEKVTKVKIDEREYYEEYFMKHLAEKFAIVPEQLQIPKLIQSKQLKRLAVLVHKCLMNQEPVLLVGETGCGKTTLCQVFAAIGQQSLFTINCHQNTETSDFIGCMRTRKNIKQTQDQLCELLQSFTQELITNGLIDQQTFELLSKDIQPNIKTLRSHISTLSKSLKTQPLLTAHLKAQFDQIKLLKDDISCIFEWHDGILVESMTQGGILLIDEISLANDSVLERLNSVFEADRTLVISEKSSKEAVKIVGHHNFKMVATMNPSGDFGKKELSPALRNRMTEIWVESYFHQTELVALYREVKNNSKHIINEIDNNVDLYLIIKETAIQQLQAQIQDTNVIEKLAKGIFNVIGFVNFILAQRYFVLQRKSLSIRDILSIIDFIKQTVVRVFQGDFIQSLRHAIELVIIDGLCLGIDVSGDRQKKDILLMCQDFLGVLEQQLFGKLTQLCTMDYLDNAQYIGVKPFALPKLNQLSIMSQNSYAFDAQTTKVNLMKLLRAYELNKPILIEGPPGVGKTSLVENLARVSGRKLIRVNLSEQTDMMDLLGSEYPVTSHEKSDGDDDDIRFHWCDGVLLQAIKEGHWFLIDEMNLAQQSVLEGLNAILDHRKTVYIPELNQEFKCHPNFYLFACQNPSQSATSVGGRKTLPKSFLNRFNKIYLEELVHEDYQCIISRLVKSRDIANLDVDKLLQLSQQIEKLIKEDQVSNQYADEGVINMRDLSRFLNLFKLFSTQEQTENESSFLQAFRICYLHRLSQSKWPQALQLLTELNIIKDALLINNIEVASLLRITDSDNSLSFQSPLKTTSIKGSASIPESFSLSNFENLKGPQSSKLQFVVDCLNCNLPLLLVSNQPWLLIENLQTLAKLAGHKINRILLNERSDTAQLLGCFEQTASDIHTLTEELNDILKNVKEAKLIAKVSEVLFQVKNHSSESYAEQIINIVKRFLEDNKNKLHKEAFHRMELKVHEIEKSLNRGGSQNRFEWIDSVLVRAIEQGEWAVFENANLCNPSILDRLNPLLEEGNNYICINEQGLIEGDQLRNVQAHDQFRSIFVINSHSLYDHGKDVSRALKNRCLQINVMYESEQHQSCQQQVTIDPSLLQMQLDMKMPLEYSFQKIVIAKQEIAFSGLGKRKNQETNFDNETVSKLLTFNEVQLQKYFSEIKLQQKKVMKAYLNYLFALKGINHQYLLNFGKKHLNAFQDLLYYLSKNVKIDEPWINFLNYQLQYKTSSIATYLKDNKSNLIMNKNTQNFLNLIVNLSSDIHIEDLLIVLQSIQQCLKFKDYNSIQSYKNLYILIQGSVPIQTILDVSLSQDYIIKLLTSSTTQMKLEDLNLYGHNQLAQSLIKQCKQVTVTLQEINQQPLLICIKQISKQEPYRIGLQALVDSFTILMLDEDKQIKRITSDNSKQLLDPYLLQETLRTAYVALIPNNIQSPAIYASLSNLYPGLCLLKDMIKLKSNKNQSNPYTRLTSIPVPFTHFREDSLTRYVLSQVYLSNLESNYTQSFNIDMTHFEKHLITQVLTASKQAKLRELPAYFLTSVSLQKHIKKYLDNIPTNFQESMQERLTRYSTNNQREYIKDIINGSKNVKDQLLSWPLVQNHLPEASSNFLDDLSVSLTLFTNESIHLFSSLKTLFLVPLELHRLTQRQSLEQLHHDSLHYFLTYQTKSTDEAKRQCKPIQQVIEEQGREIERLKKVEREHSCQGNEQSLLRGLLMYLEELHRQVEEAVEMARIGQNRDGLATKLAVIERILIRGVEQYILEFNNFLELYLSAVVGIVQSLKQLLVFKDQTLSNLVNCLFNGKPSDLNTFSPTTLEPLRTLKSKFTLGTQPLFELYLKYLLKFQRLNNSKPTSHSLLSTLTLDHFVHREVAKKLKEEEELASMEELVYRLPFKMKVQSLMENNKAIDERTQEDKDKMEREAKKEIERNFPSYFDEMQRVVFSGQVETSTTDDLKKSSQEVRVEKILQELLGLEKTVEQREGELKRQMVKLRVKMLEKVYELQGQVSLISLDERTKDSPWLIEVSNYLREDLTQSAIPSVMNVSEVRLANEYNFYHDTLPQEARLVYEPLNKLLARADAIIQEYESPILQDVIFLANYMLTTFSPKTAPLMKILTGLELLLNKLEEWEVYASKSLNSCQNEMTLLKQLIIRYRKIQILSWRNLLQWKKTQMIREDFQENFLRLAHTLERQVFDKLYYKTAQAQQGKDSQEVEMKIMEVLDLFMRDSSLGQFQSRLAFLKLLLESFQEKESNTKLLKIKLNAQMRTRLQKVIRILDFVWSYYRQFEDKLASTLARLDADAREKVKTLIDVSKWTVQKFSQVKNNIDKRHRQLNKACKQEEEALMQNVSHLVLTSSRKKYIKREEGLAGLEIEKSALALNEKQFENPIIHGLHIDIALPSIINQMSNLEKRFIQSKWPDCLSIESSIFTLFERLKIVRDVNKRHIQRRAFVDLLKFLKEQGLQHNFQSQILPQLLETKLVSLDDSFTNNKDFSKYYLKSHELLLMLENSSEAENATPAHLRNIDIIRVRGFSQSMILRILQLNQSLDVINQKFKLLQTLCQESETYIKTENEEESQVLQLSSICCKKYSLIVSDYQQLCQNIEEQTKMIAVADGANEGFKVVNSGYSLNQTLVSTLEITKLSKLIEQLRSDLILWANSTVNSRLRSLALDVYLPQLELLTSRILDLTTAISTSEQNSNILSKRVSLLQKHSQLFLQDSLKELDTLYEQLSKRRDSQVTDITTDAPKQDEEDNRVELTIKEHQEFTDKIRINCIDKHIPQVLEIAEKIFKFKGIKGIDEKEVKKELELATRLVQKVTSLMRFIVENQYTYLRSLAKLSFISQRIFIYLIYEGFCGEEDKEEEEDNKQQQEEDDKYFENDGMGMGDGKGGKENVSNQIEHEEQLEGLKNYESEDEQKPQEKEEKQEQKDEEQQEDNDFEMKEDFEGDLEDRPQDDKEEEDKKSEQSDEDDQLDDVDDLLDNKLWNENMQDLEDREKEEDERKEEPTKKDDVDLGERDLDEQNQKPQKPEEKELTAGDHDKQESKEETKKKEEQEQVGEDGEDQQMKDEEEEEQPNPNEEEGEEQEASEIPLDRDPNVMEDIKEEEKSDDQDLIENEKSFTDDNPDQEHSEEPGSDYSDQQEDQELNSEVSGDDENDDYKKDFNKQMLENDQEQNPLEDKKEPQQSNLRKPKNSNMNQEQRSKQNQAQQQNVEDMNTQFDVEGSDILFQLSNKIKQQQPPQSQPQNSNKENKPEPKEEGMKEIQEPKMSADKPQQKQDQQDQAEAEKDDQAMEYEYDQDQVEQLQGRLATDQLDSQQQQQQLHEPNPEDQEMLQQEEEEQPAAKQKTDNETQRLLEKQQQVKATEEDQADIEGKNRSDDQKMMEEEQKEGDIQEKELIEEYQEYLTKRLRTELNLLDKESEEKQVTQPSSNFTYELEHFDYGASRQRIRELFNEWQSNSKLVGESQSLLQRFKQETSSSAASLCEQLRIVLEPQLSQQLQGDYKTGKRLNMKKVISFIASHYRNDKIWLRRTMPSKRDYKILIAIDDTLSMREGGLGFFSLEALTTITEALHRLEVGKVAVAAIRERMELLQSFEEGAQLSNERTSFALSQFTFQFSAPKSADFAMANFIRDANQMFDSQNASGGGDLMNLPFVIVLSDGRFNKNNVRQYLNEAREKRYLYIFVILDQVKETTVTGSKKKQSDGSILSMKSVEKGEDGGIKLVPYLKDFPFEYYCIVRDVHQLPTALGSILVQWFSLINNSNVGSS